MAIRVTISSLAGNSFEEVAEVETSEKLFRADVYAGKIILAECLNNRGMDVHVTDGIYDDNVIPLDVADEMKARANFYQRVMPWMSINLPFHILEGEPANIKLQSLPTVWVDKVRYFHASED